ncbi:alpha/beta fold hydrolase [Nakamurella leprariae]|uniref:Alpha/beta hydrolase n=1 Tax=Nakamurella leprariae TaxID=2803911 RepID=A0A939C1W0_9ACTN|nr:alpha/beta hydrolase [Nakamurella leprariae]MBM9467574.1 alpha/beta hydrolase [Nakamurella leprariae]
MAARPSTVGRLVGAAGIVTGVVGAAALGGMTAQRRAVRHYRDVTAQAVGELAGVPDDVAYDSLVPDRSYSVVSDDGVVLAVEEVGPADAPLTVVFAHGWTLRAGAWHYQRLALSGGWPRPDGAGGAQERTAPPDDAGMPVMRLVFYDQRSHGRSSRAPLGSSTMAHLADDLAAVVATAAPTGPLVVVGHSMGAMALLTLAGRDERFVQRLVGVGLISTTATALRQPELTRMLVSGSNPLLKVLTATAARYPALFERGRRSSRDAVWLLTRTLGFARRDVPGAMVDYLDEMISSTPADVIADFLPVLLSMDQRPALARLTGRPTLILCGDADRMTPISRSRAMAAALPGAEMVTVAGAGHMAILEAPAEVNQAVRRLLVRAADRAGLLADGQASRLLAALQDAPAPAAPADGEPAAGRDGAAETGRAVSR